MTQQTFSVSRNPQVIITQVDASLSVQACQEQVISVETAASSVALLQEGDKLIITNCQSDLELRVPALKNSNISITTDITAIMVRELLDSNYSSMETSYCWVPDHYAACNAFHLKEEFSLAQLDHYRRMLATYHEHGLISMVTFHHFI